MPSASAIPTNANPRVLCVEDDLEIARMLCDMLKDNGFDASFVHSAAEMEGILGKYRVDLIILDVMLPGEDGLSICRRLRAESSIPIIMVTARGEDIDRIIGLEIGADDYVTKPFNSRELVARIRALLRRVQGATKKMHLREQPLTFSGWRLDPSARELHDPEGIKIALTGVEFELLLSLCRNSGRPLSREQLIDLIHGGQVGSIERSIDVHISRIRQKIEADPRTPVMIKTIRLGGYMFTPAVEQQ